MASVDRTVGTQVARIAGEDPIMDAVATRGAARARAIAQSHFRTGRYASSLGTARIRGKRGVTDRAFFSDDPAATWIEWGHMTRGGDRWVAGLHILGRAAGSL